MAALLILPPGRGLAAQAQANSPQRDLEVLRRLEEEYLRAEIEDDTAIAGTILADDYVGLRPDGSSSTKADVLNRLGLHERRRQPYLITATNMRQALVWRYGLRDLHQGLYQAWQSGRVQRKRAPRSYSA